MWYGQWGLSMMAAGHFGSSPYPCHRSHPPLPFAMTELSQGLLAILTSANCHDEKFKTWLTANEIVNADGLGLLAATETALEDKVFPMLRAAQVDTTKLSLMISIKKAWHLSRGQVDKDQATASGRAPAISPDEPLAAPTRSSLTEGWHAKHGFTLSNDRLLTETIIAQLHRELHSSPKRLGIHLAESLRLQSSIATTGKKYATISEGYLATEEHIADQVSNVLELYTRIRAFFNTVAFVCIHDGDFFTLQDVVFVEDKMLNLLQLSKHGTRPPVVFFTSAWASLMQLWSDEIRTTGKSLAALTRETASWTPAWLTWNPPSPGASSQDYTLVPSSGAGSTKDRDLQAELDKARKWAASMQSDHDRLQNQLVNANRGRSRSRYSRGRESRGRDGYGHGRYQGATPKSAGGKGSNGGNDQRKR